MRVVVCDQTGDFEALRLEERGLPEPQGGEVRIAVEAADATFADGLIVLGRYQVPFPTPFTPGAECSGTIDAVGSGVVGWSVGDRVFASTDSGAFAEYVIARAEQLTPLPRNLSFDRGASFLQAYCTAWFALTRRGSLQSNEVVLVTGGGGGAGLAAIDVSVNLGARVIASASSPEKRKMALAHGAFAAIDSSSEDVKNRAREITGGEGIDVVYDVVGGDGSEGALRALKFGGRFLVIGFAAGIPSVSTNHILLNNRTVIGVDWGGWASRRPDENRVLVSEVVDEAARGRLHPVEPRRRSLADAANVLKELHRRQIAGKVVIVPRMR